MVDYAIGIWQWWQFAAGSGIVQVLENWPRAVQQVPGTASCSHDVGASSGWVVAIVIAVLLAVTAAFHLPWLAPVSRQELLMSLHCVFPVHFAVEGLP